jgi:ABC-type sulfate transport system permease subunit
MTRLHLQFLSSPLITKVSILLVTAGTSVCSPVSSSNFYEMIFKLPPFCVVKTEQSVTIKFIVKLMETSTKSSDFYVSLSATTTEMPESSYLTH